MKKNLNNLLNTKSTYFYVIILLSILILPSCRSVPYTDRSQFIITSKSSEIQLGKTAWNETLKKSKVSQNKHYNAALKRVGTNLAASVKEKDYDWEFIVLESDEANAFCLPGGKVAVYSGLFKTFGNDAELATIVGHEIAHALARHSGERLTHLYMQNLGSLGLNVAFSIVNIPGGGWILQGLGIATGLGVTLPYSRIQEYEADRIGMIIMSNAGYSPDATVSFWKKFSQISKNDSSILEFFATHPMDEKRLEEMKNFLPEANKYYKEAPVKKKLGIEYKTEDQQTTIKKATHVR